MLETRLLKLAGQQITACGYKREATYPPTYLLLVNHIFFIEKKVPFGISTLDLGQAVPEVFIAKDVDT